MTERKKPGPKPKAKSKRVKPYSIGLNDEHTRYIERQARKEGISTSEYIRDLIEADIRRSERK